MSAEPRSRRVLYRWDLDKTYLRTEFDTLAAMVRTAFEHPRRKQTVPGAAVLLRELQGSEHGGIHILSGSPEEMRPMLERKLSLDGVRWDSLTLKPSLRNLVRGRFRFVWEQVGYKLGALLASRAEVHSELDEILFGDDAEADAFIYSFYADICAGRVSESSLVDVLERARVEEEESEAILGLASRVPKRTLARRILIHLDRVSLPSVFRDFGVRVFPFHNYFQAALVLLEEGVVDPAGVLRVGVDIVSTHGFSPDTLAASFSELVGRQCLSQGASKKLLDHMEHSEHATIVESDAALLGLRATAADLLGSIENPTPTGVPTLDYVALFARDRARAKGARRGARTRARRRRS